MWTFRRRDAGRGDATRFEVLRGTRPASFAEVIAAWRTEPAFCSWFSDLLAAAPYAAFRWESPAVTLETEQQPYEFVLLDSPTLARPSDPSAFAEHFGDQPSADVISFANLGRDATMVVPRPVGSGDAHGHLAAFVRAAPREQRALLWRTVGEAMRARVGTKPVWLSTAGAGVAWLHVRLDDRPKYYGFAPYRARPAYRPA